jgi:glycosyltransferase involved in cell wall biosynthesis
MKISVITATFNSISTLAQCLDSVRVQTYPHLDHVLIDGGSTDGTAALLQSRREQFAVLVSEPDGGIYDALNKGLDRATGEVIGFLHSDDWYPSPDVLSAVAAPFGDPTVDAVYGDLEYVNKNDITHVIRRWQAGQIRRSSLALGWMPPHPTLFVRRRAYEALGGFDTRYSIAADYHSVLRLFSQPGFKAVYVPNVLVKMRVGGTSNRSLGNVMKKSRQDLMALRQTGVGGWGSLLAKNLRKFPQFFT